jgi:catechol 2,3-dioxygenase-like lactoylglutathione lyase family enzyme
MEGFVAEKLNDYASGKLSRRGLIEMLTLAATTAYTGGAKAAEQSGLKMALINHISYNCPDFRPAADWYSKAFNLDPVGATDHDVALPFGKKGDLPYGVTATDVPLTHLIIRTRDLNAPAANGTTRPKPQAMIDHICYTIADFNQDKVKAELTTLGATNVRNSGPISVMATDPIGYEIQISGLASTALSGGG